MPSAEAQTLIVWSVNLSSIVLALLTVDRTKQDSIRYLIKRTQTRLLKGLTKKRQQTWGYTSMHAWDTWYFAWKCSMIGSFVDHLIAAASLFSLKNIFTSKICAKIATILLLQQEEIQISAWNYLKLQFVGYLLRLQNGLWWAPNKESWDLRKQSMKENNITNLKLQHLKSWYSVFRIQGIRSDRY
jgi:hypothetical protein